MKMFSSCSGPCETCANYQYDFNCLAGHGDDHYVERGPKVPNSVNRKNLKAVIDLMSDGHADVTKQASDVNTALLRLDELLNTKEGKPEIYRKFSQRKLEVLLEMLTAHEARVGRVREEIGEILRNIRLI